MHIECDMCITVSQPPVRLDATVNSTHHHVQYINSKRMNAGLVLTIIISQFYTPSKSKSVIRCDFSEENENEQQHKLSHMNSLMISCVIKCEKLN